MTYELYVQVVFELQYDNSLRKRSQQLKFHIPSSQFVPEHPQNQPLVDVIDIADEHPPTLSPPSHTSLELLEESPPTECLKPANQKIPLTAPATEGYSHPA